jgi:membrane protein YdbS with pleckstrin-like domain
VRTDDQLTRLWRNTERFTEASLLVAIALGFAGSPLNASPWPEWMLWAFMLPLMVASVVAKLACLWVLRPWMDRRGLDWEKAPIWWVR